MEHREDTPRSRDMLAGEFLALAREYRRVSACLADARRQCEQAGVQHDQVLEITFTHVASYIDGGADQMEHVAARLTSRPEGDLACDTSFPETGAILRLEEVPRALRNAASALEAAMERALDAVDEVDDAELVGDSHPFGHIIQGICLPYLFLAAEVLDGGAA